MIGVFIRKDILDTDIPREKTAIGVKEKGLEQILLVPPSERTKPSDTWILGFRPPELWTIYFCRLSLSACSIFVMAA